MSPPRVAASVLPSVVANVAANVVVNVVVSATPTAATNPAPPRRLTLQEVNALGLPLAPLDDQSDDFANQFRKWAVPRFCEPAQSLIPVREMTYYVSRPSPGSATTEYLYMVLLFADEASSKAAIEWNLHQSPCTWGLSGFQIDLASVRPFAQPGEGLRYEYLQTLPNGVKARVLGVFYRSGSEITSVFITMDSRRIGSGTLDNILRISSQPSDAS